MRFTTAFKFLLLIIFSFPAVAVQASDFDNGVKEAKAKNWPEAEKSFRICIQKNPSDAHAYYNLGTSLAAQKKEPEAIWALEKSLKLNPSLKQASTNLQYCYTKLGIPETWEPALPYFQDKAYQFGIDSWTYISITLGIISAILIFFFITSPNSRTRKISLIFAVFTFLSLIFTLRSALNSYDFKYSNTHAIMLYDESSVFYDAEGNMKFDLYLKRGTRYEIEGTANGRIGLVMKNEMVVWIDDEMVKVF